MADLQEKSIELWRDAHFELHWKLCAAEARIKKLEAALRKIALHPDPYLYNDEMAIIARKALEGKDGQEV